MRLLHEWTLLVAGTVGAACLYTSPQPAHAPPPTPPAAPSIELRPLTITFQGRPIARLHADGRTESVGPNASGDGPSLPGPTLRSDGTIVLTKGGYTARIASNGDIYVVSPAGKLPREHLFGNVSGNHLRIGKDGGVRVDEATLAYDHPTQNVIGRIEGPVDENSRRTALIMTAAFFIDMAITTR